MVGGIYDGRPLDPDSMVAVVVRKPYVDSREVRVMRRHGMLEFCRASLESATARMKMHEQSMNNWEISGQADKDRAEIRKWERAVKDAKESLQEKED